MKPAHTALSLSFFLFFLIPPGFGGDNRSVSEMVEQFQIKQSSWAYFEADISLDFFLKEGGKSTCSGKLFFQRLSEKFLLTCSDSNGEPFFYFRAEDMDFWLHLPADEVLVTGNIFDLEFSEEFESFIKPLAIYRALKPGIPLPDETKIEQRGDDWAELIQQKNYHEKPYPARKIILTSEGNIAEEMFLLPSGKVMTQIRRKDFRQLPWKKPSSIAFSTLIQSPKDETALVLTLEKINSTELPEEDVFLLEIPYETEIVTVESQITRKPSPGWSRSL